jgi:biotin carboxyl carrier protein
MAADRSRRGHAEVVAMKLFVRLDGREKQLQVFRENGRYRVEMDGRVLSVDCRTFGDGNTYSLLIDGRSYLIESAPVRPEEGEYYARVMGRHYDVEVLDELLVAVRDAERAKEHAGGYVVRAPMPGLVIQVKVAPGNHVSVGDSVVVMEAMKMRNELITEVGGVVKEVVAAPGDKVESQAALVKIERE